MKEEEKYVIGFKHSVNLKSILSSIADFLIIIYPTGIIQSVNRATCDMLEYRENEIVGKKIELIFHEDTNTGSEELKKCAQILSKNMKQNQIFSESGINKLIESGSIKDVLGTCITKTGKRIPVSFTGSVIHDDEDNAIKIIITVHDMRQALALINERTSELTILMERMVQSMAEGVVMVDEHGEVLVINPRARQLLNFDFDTNITAAAWKEKITSIGLREDTMTKFEDNNSMITNEVKISNMGESIFLNCEMTPVKDLQGNRIGIVTIIRDVTKEKEIDRMKTEFISIVSHELRTPLSIIKDGIGLVLDKTLGDINEKQERFLSVADNNIDRLSSVINNLLDISIIEAGKIELKKSSVNLQNLIKGIASTFSRPANDKGLNLTVDLPEKQIDIYADSEKIIQIFTNLISNSLKFSEKGYIKISIRDIGNKVECCVADTGIGIAGEDLSKVFGKFHQFNRVPGSGEKGTGLGLAITKVLVELHGGKIWIESQLGKGTKIYFTFQKYSSDMNKIQNY